MTGDVLLVRVTEAARRLGIGRTKTYELISDGRLEVVRIDGAVRVPVEAIEQFVSSSRALAAHRVRYGDEVIGGRPIHPLR
ncbi:MAG TPA: helix-turn-helix domain-containing protein [Microthrixaceae bacterium]|nr:helix-turn-helix domain-containing protein [Microthrixaceae bacterium]